MPILEGFWLARTTFGWVATSLLLVSWLTLLAAPVWRRLFRRLVVVSMGISVVSLCALFVGAYLRWRFVKSELDSGVPATLWDVEVEATVIVWWLYTGSIAVVTTLAASGCVLGVRLLLRRRTGDSDAP